MVSSELWFGAEASFYNGVATQSLRFDSASSASLSGSMSSSPYTWTFSAWVKRSKLSSLQVIGASRTSGVFASYISFQTANTLEVVLGSGGTQTTTRLFRDTSAWYHLVVSCTGASGTAKLYINSVEEMSWSAGSTPYLFTNTLTHKASIGQYGGNAYYFDGYMAEVNFVVGNAYDPTYFGETKNGVWIPKKYSGSYGTDSFRLEFKETGVGTGASDTIGADTSGNGHHFTSTNVSAHDCNMPDSPENNWATLNSIYNPKNNPPTFSEGNLKATASQVAYQNTFSTIGVSSGKWYVEMKQNGTTNSANFIGIVDEEAFSDFHVHSHYIGSATVEGVNYGYYMHSGNKYVDGTSSSYGSRTNDGEIIGIALDLDNGKLYFSVDGTFVASGDPVNGTNFMAENIPSGTYFFGTTLYQNGYTSGVWNFGQDPSFGGSVTAGTETPSEGAGVFKHAVPSGYKALCSANLPEPTISPNADTQADDHFNTVTYTGNATDDRAVTGVGFQPDWVWIKSRSSSFNHILVDSSRGLSAGYLASNNTNAESGDASLVKTITSDGFTLGTSGAVNGSSASLVAWNWKANGTTPTKTYKVVVVSDSGNKYRFRNSADSATFAQSAVTLDLQEGGTYVFDWSDSTAQGHPIRFSTTSDGTHGGGSEYTTGVVKDDSAYKTTITVASSAPTLYYYCQYHSGMGGQINTNTTFGSTNFDGSLLSVSNPNTTAGFSIVTTTGNGSSGATIGHGLNATPKWIISKQRNDANHWAVYHHEIGTGNEVYLSLTQQQTSSNFWITDPTTSVFSVSGSDYVNENNSTYVFYCFAEKEGYSKFGSFTGNGSTDGTFCLTNFAVKWLMVKRTDTSDNWAIYDSARDTFNVRDSYLYADSSQAEATYSTAIVDFLSNGFKWRGAVNFGNASGGTYIYMAFGSTFKFATAR